VSGVAERVNGVDRRARALLAPLLWCLAAAAAGCAAVTPAPGPAPAAPAAAPADPAALRVMTFNIRYGTAPDGPDAWPLRRPIALRVIADFDPAVLGLQEALRFQLDEIERALPAYGEVGVGRDDGAQAGEYAAILFDRRRLAVLEQGTFWLSDTPAVPGSMTWGNRFPRVVTWARFADRVASATFYVFDTHWDHESQPSRERSARLMLERIAARAAAGDPVLVTGDFNSGEDNPAFRTLLASDLTETFRALHPSARDVRTFHAFKGDRHGDKIDAVLASPAWRTLDADIVHTSAGGRYPSDHFPVTATVVLRRAVAVGSGGPAR
jgi:endonuclease/exonuclease/phosphatase family metal-dependent hydrolase